MQNPRWNEPVPIDRRTSPFGGAGSIDVLTEMVAALAERVELLETRENLAHGAVSRRESRHRPQP